ncbi:hypothetical protein GCM10007921_28720 [Tritonibacter mobilis]|nr:hypothetical protein GCM10007921_28720 [Tritonibacter mobilis]
MVSRASQAASIAVSSCALDMCSGSGFLLDSGAYSRKSQMRHALNTPIRAGEAAGKQMCGGYL